MSLHSGGSAASHLQAVRLSDIPFKQRMAAARTAAKTCKSSREICEVMAAALAPSDKTYWIRAAAVEDARLAA